MSEWEVVGQVKPKSNDGWEVMGEVATEKKQGYMDQFKSFPGDIKAAHQNRVQQGSQVLSDYFSGKVGGVASSARAGGTAGHFLGDVVGETFSTITPPSVKGFLKEHFVGTDEEVQNLMNQPAVKATTDFLSQWKQDNPETAKTIEQGAGIANVFVAGAGQQALAKAANKEFHKQLITPHPSLIHTKDPRRWRKTRTGALEYIPTRKDRLQASVLKTVPGLKPSPGMNMGRANELIQKEISRVNNNLLKGLAKNTRPISSNAVKRKLLKDFTEVNSKLPKIDRLTNDEIIQAVDTVMHYVNATDRTAKGILKARRAIDKRFTNAKANRAVDRIETGAELSPNELRWQTARNSLNNMLESMASGSKKDLRRMHYLIEAGDTVWDKARRTDERLWTKAKEKVGLGPTAMKFARGGS